MDIHRSDYAIVKKELCCIVGVEDCGCVDWRHPGKGLLGLEKSRCDRERTLDVGNS